MGEIEVLIYVLDMGEIAEFCIALFSDMGDNGEGR